MALNYKAILDHEPSDDDGKALDVIANHVASCSQAILDILVRCGANAQDVGILRLRDDAIMHLTTFALSCDALPMRTPKMLMATAEEIIRNPQIFQKEHEKFDPEVNAMVFDELARLSPEDPVSITKFDRGGRAPPSEQIVQAASNVVVRLKARAKEQKGGGRPHLELQTELAFGMGRIFRAHGGKITRVTFDGETGPFHEFLELLLSVVRPFARTAGFDLNVATMVEKAQRDPPVKPRKLKHISCYPVNPLV